MTVNKDYYNVFHFIVKAGVGTGLHGIGDRKRVINMHNQHKKCARNKW